MTLLHYDKLNYLLPSGYQGHMDRVKRIWYLSAMRAAKVQASLRIRAVSPEPSLLAHTSSESRRTFRQKTRSLAPLNGWICAVEICHDGMLEDTNSLDGAHLTRLQFTKTTNLVTFRTFNSRQPWLTINTWYPLQRSDFDVNNTVGKIIQNCTSVLVLRYFKPKII